MDDHSSDLILPQEHVQDDPAIAHWSILDTWLGIVMFVVLIFLTLYSVTFFPSVARSPFFMIGFEALLLVPIAVIFLWRKISWKELGFRKFNWSEIALGCGVLLIVYVLIFIHNLILAALGVVTQADTIFEAFDSLDSPVWFFFVGVVMAPLMEETFFRGFLCGRRHANPSSPRFESGNAKCGQSL